MTEAKRNVQDIGRIHATLAPVLTQVPVPSVMYSGTINPSPVSVDLSPTGPYKAAILGSTGSDGSQWQVAALVPTPIPTPVPTTTWGNTVLYDLYGAPVRTDLFAGLNYGAHEAPINLNPGYDWAKGARPGQLTPGSNQCAEFWGQFFDGVNGWPTSTGGSTPAANNSGIRVHIRYPEMWTASSTTGVWSKTYSVPSIGGALYDYNFNGGSALGNIRSESSGGWSFLYTSGSINHIWDGSWPRPLNVPGASYVFHIRAQVRLIADTTANPANARILGSCATDWYPNNSATASIAAGIGQPRLRYVTPTWQWFTYTGVSQAALTSNVPPVPTQALV